MHEKSPRYNFTKRDRRKQLVWFSILIKPGSKLRRKDLLKKMKKLGFECRPIVSGNFAKNKVVKYFNYKIFGNLKMQSI